MTALPNMQRVAGAPPFHAAPRPAGWFRHLARIRYQLSGGLLLAVAFPAFVRNEFRFDLGVNSLSYTVVGTAVALLAGAYVLRRLLPYPGVQGLSFVLPTLAGTYGISLATFFFLRIDYSRFQFLASFILAVIWFVTAAFAERRYKRPHLAIVPCGNVAKLPQLSQADWSFLGSPESVPPGTTGIVADLRADLPAAWETFLAHQALKGVPVYHSKHVMETLTGQVQIEHLSENSLGTLVPSSVYLRLKRLLDTLFAILVLPVVLLIAAAAALAIRLDDGGPVFFKQPRLGHRGLVFNIVKFRTMCTAPDGCHFTEVGDKRVTRVGRFLRRYRIDELPQIVNIFRGEMSWIGPRPEALPLSQAYEKQIPFYSYRHIVRPGITGWAQVQQGWAAAVEDVASKLHFDFYYIKHFSPWLDALIVVRTVRTILTGFGAR